MEKYKRDFIDFLIRHQALKFGEFTLKSGRLSPYFFSTGLFNTGGSVYQLGHFYARKIIESGLDFEIIFGPAYKGIPLAVAIAAVLARDFKKDKPYFFDRKEIKDYADQSAFVGYEPAAGEKVLLIDDVMTTGLTKEEAVSKIRARFPQSKISGLLIAFDRQEKNEQGRSALEEFEKKYQIPVHSIVTIKEVAEYLEEKGGLNQKQCLKIKDYLKKYGV